MIVGEHPVWRYSMPFAASSAISRRLSQLVIFSSAAPVNISKSLNSFVCFSMGAAI
uniref:Uncharacterized protein n=1 Tax=Arundo donax TaxID=35708 RepID=A0A0A9DIT3_ARUDO